MKKRRILVFLALVIAAGLVVLGVSFIFWPAGAITAGLLLAIGAVMIDLDAPPQQEGEQEVDIIDETEESMPVIARVRG